MKNLTEREKKVLELRSQGMLLKDIAKILGKSHCRETIRAIEAKALRKIKEQTEGKTG